MFTGLLPIDHHADQDHLSVRSDLVLLASQLAQAGYQTAGFTENPWISDDTGLSRGFQVFQPLWGRRKAATPTEKVGTLDAIRTFFRRQRDDSRPLFLFVNLMKAHGPYRPKWDTARHFFPNRRSFKSAQKAGMRFGELPINNAWYVMPGRFNANFFEKQRTLYDAEIRGADRMAEQILGLVGRYCALSEATVILASDHGQNFGDHDHAGHAFSLYQSTLGVLLAARGPRFEAGRRVEAPASLTDIFPTFLAEAGLPLPEGIEGRDLGLEIPRLRSVRATYAWPFQALSAYPEVFKDHPVLNRYKRSLVVAVRGRYKIIRGSDGSEEIYDLEADPKELRPLQGIPEGVREELRKLAGDFPPMRRAPEAPQPALPQETEEALRNLGYLE
jgi:arylsulfatase A-like enzyme